MHWKRASIRVFITRLVSGVSWVAWRSAAECVVLAGARDVIYLESCMTSDYGLFVLQPQHRGHDRRTPMRPDQAMA